MKLLSLNTYNYRRGGSDTVFFEHDKLFQENQWNTAVFTMQHPNNEHSSWDKYFVNELEFGNDYSFFQRIVMASKIIYSWEARKNLDRLLKVFNPDIAHVHCIYHHLSPSVLSLLKSKNIPVVMTAHDLKLACPAYKMFNENGICEKCKNNNLIHVMRNKCIHNSLPASTLVAVESSIHKLLGLYKNNLDKVVVPSIFFKIKLMEWGWPEEKLNYIPNFIYAEKFKTNFKPGEYFLYFGRLAPEKGIKTLIEATKQAAVKLRIIGTGPIEDEIKILVKENEENIQMLGYKSGDDLWDEVKHARAIVLPSEWYENAPMSLLEAYACGKPVIGAKIGGIPEMIQENKTGFTFTSGDSQQLATKLTHIQNLPNSEIEQLGKNAREYVESTFTRQRYFEDMLDLYASLGVSTNGLKQKYTGVENGCAN